MHLDQISTDSTSFHRSIVHREQHIWTVSLEGLTTQGAHWLIDRTRTHTHKKHLKSSWLDFFCLLDYADISKIISLMVWSHEPHNLYWLLLHIFYNFNSYHQQKSLSHKVTNFLVSLLLSHSGSFSLLFFLSPSHLDGLDQSNVYCSVIIVCVGLCF